jgi:glycerol-1-phosphate dehydrogenase [NAD(P)+]
MQAVGQSRPASSAEHTVAHLWEIAHAAANTRHDLHGLLVGLVCALVEGCFSDFYAGLREGGVDTEARLAELSLEAAGEPSLDTALVPFRAQIERARATPSDSTLPLRERLRRLEEGRGAIADLAGPLLKELREAVVTLGGIGFPLRLSDYGLSAAWALLPMRNVRLLRNRYSSFHLVHQLGGEPALLRCLQAEIVARA